MPPKTSRKKSTISPSHHHERDTHPRSGSSYLPLAVLILILMIAFAAGGVYMFAQRSILFAVNASDEFSNDVLEAINAAQEAQPPSTVNLSFYLATTIAAGQKSQKPFLKTRLLETDVKLSDSFPATGTATTAGKSSGTVTIINDTSRPFTLVVPTRFLSKEGVLFRLQKQTVVPSGGSVDAPVAADKPGSAGDIGPTTFILPGLSSALQSQVYAKSSSAMTGGAGVGKAVAQQDIDAAKAALTTRLRETAKGNFAAMITTDEKVVDGLVASSELAFTTPAIGTAGEAFTATLSLRFSALPLPELQIMTLLGGQRQQLISSQGLNGTYTLAPTTYTVNAFDPKVNQAEVQAQAELVQK